MKSLPKRHRSDTKNKPAAVTITTTTITTEISIDHSHLNSEEGEDVKAGHMKNTRICLRATLFHEFSNSNKSNKFIYYSTGNSSFRL
jgi:hypothetical protein